MNFFTIILLGLIPIIFGNDDSLTYYDYTSNYDISSEIEERLTGGKAMDDLNFRRFNYQVGLYTETNALCGGVLIHRKIVLTAAHCVLNANYVGIFMGTIVKPKSIISSGNIIVSSDYILYHAGYNNETWENDIAVITLPYEVELNAYKQIIRLAKYSDNCQVGQARVSGWGKMNNNNDSVSSLLNYADVLAMNTNFCQQHYWPHLVVQKQLCTNIVPDGYASVRTCQGDSGGGYVFEKDGDRYLCGVNAFIHTTCLENYPTALTAVAYYHENGWICWASGGLVGCPYNIV